MALYIFAIARSITEISLDLDQLNHLYQRNSGLTVDYGEYFKLIAAWSTDCSGMPPP